MKRAKQRVESVGEARRKMNSIIVLLDMAEENDVPLQRAGLITVAEEEIQILSRLVRPWAKRERDDAWPASSEESEVAAAAHPYEEGRG